MEDLIRSVLGLMLGPTATRVDNGMSASVSPRSPSLGGAGRGEMSLQEGTTDPRTKASCMLSLKEYIMFCQRLRILPDELELVEVRGAALSSRGQPLFMDALRYVLEANHVFYFMNRNAFSTMWTCHQEVGHL